MAIRRASSKTVETEPSRSRIPTRTVTLHIPENSVLVMIGALMVVSFLIGVLVTNVSFKLKGISGVAGTTAGQTAGTAGNTAAGTVPAAPTGPAQAVKVDNGHFPALGDTNAKVKVIEFADFRCPFCEQLFTSVAPALKTDFIDSGKVQFYFRQYAFLGPASTVAANAAECANDQGKFWEMHDWFYQNQPAETDTSMYTVDKLTAAAGDLGMDTAKFSDCLTNNNFQKDVDKDMSEGGTAGVTGTPATFVNGKLISGACPLATFEGAINAELDGKDWNVNNCTLTVL